MSREIKFRAWDENHKATHYSDDCTLDWLFDLPKRHGGAVMQYTGLRDKNGKEIYEGDIVRMTEHMNPSKFRPGTMVIEWDEKNAGWGGIYPTLVPWSLFEVVGNIYENPELLRPQ